MARRGGGDGSRRQAPVRSTALIGAGLRIMLHRRARLLSDERYWVERAGMIQREQLRRLLRRAARTEVGREHGFAAIAQSHPDDLVRAYRDAVAPGDYEAWRERYARMREQAQPDVAWPGIVEDWAQTSGTTGGEKFIPVSREMTASNQRAALDIFAHAIRFGVSLPCLFSGKLLFLGGSTAVSSNRFGIRTGDLSGLAARTIRWPLTRVYSPGLDIALMDHWPSKIDAMARRCAGQDIRMVSGMASWALILFQRMVEVAREQGREVTTLRDLWPNLDLFVHGGVKYAPFDPRVREAWSGRADLNDPGADIPYRLEVYPASEGFIATQDTPGDPGLRLNVDIGNFYEFIPVEEIDSPGARAFMAHEVDKGQRYVVVMTTCAGLWRYIIGDMVEFDTIPPDGPARLRIVGRHRQFINAFGENLIVEQIENAVAEAQRETGVQVGEFTAAPVYPSAGTRAGLQLAVEWQHEFDADVERFRRVFDESLKRQNVDYSIKRTEGFGMDAPTITTLPPGTFHRWMERRGKLGGQHKTPRCANSRDIIDDVIETSAVLEPAP